MVKVARRIGRSDEADPLAQIHPGVILEKEFMWPEGLRVSVLAAQLDVPANRISGILKGRRGVTAESALLLGERFGTGPEFWTDLQARYDLESARLGLGLDPRSRLRHRSEQEPRYKSQLKQSTDGRLGRNIRSPERASFPERDLIRAAAVNWLPAPVQRASRQMATTTIRIPADTLNLLRDVAQAAAGEGERPSVSALVVELIERAKVTLVREIAPAPGK